MEDLSTSSLGQRALDIARVRVLAAGRTGDPLAAEHASRAYVAAVHLGMLRGLAQRASAAAATGAYRLAGVAHLLSPRPRKT